MKKTLLALLLGCALVGCADNREINGVTYGHYGLFNEAEMHNPKVQYELSTGSVIVAVIFCSTVIIPLYVIGWDLYEPIGLKDPTWVPGQVK